MNNASENTTVSSQGETPEHAEAARENAQRRSEIRKEVLAERKELPKPYRLHKSAAICEALAASLQFSAAALGVQPSDCTVAVYSAFEDEVQLHDFIMAAYDLGATVAFPCMIDDAWGVEGACPQTMEMRAVSREDYEAGNVVFLNSPLKKFVHESKELAPYPYVPGNELTMIVVPLVAFDKEGNRLGYGGGNYDRYLTQLNEDARKVGVAFSEQEVPLVPTEEHDIPLPILAK